MEDVEYPQFISLSLSLHKFYWYVLSGYLVRFKIEYCSLVFPCLMLNCLCGLHKTFGEIIVLCVWNHTFNSKYDTAYVRVWSSDYTHFYCSNRLLMQLIMGLISMTQTSPQDMWIIHTCLLELESLIWIGLTPISLLRRKMKLFNVQWF